MASHPETVVLAMVVHNSMNDPDLDENPAGSLINAAVHAWMEGHVEGEGRAGTHTVSDGPPTEPMPSPPFPGRDDENLRDILHEAHTRFSGQDPVCAVMYAAALAYAKGIEEGRGCPGCATPGVAEVGARVRVGQAAVVLQAGALTTMGAI